MQFPDTRILCALAAASALLVPCAPRALAEQQANAADDDPGIFAILIDEDLESTKVRISSIEGGAVTYTDRFGRVRQAMVSGLRAVLPVDESADTGHGFGVVSLAGANTMLRGDDGEIVVTRSPDETLVPRVPPIDGFIELIDGRRFPGKQAETAGGPGDTVLWDHPKFQRITVSLDDIALLRRATDGVPVVSLDAPERPADGQPIEDELLLVNGDRLAGFILALGNPISIETDAGVIDLPPERVVEALLSNPRAAPTGLMVWLSDGTVAQVADIDAPEGSTTGDVNLTLTAGGQATYRAHDVRGIAFGAELLVPLSSIRPLSQEPVEGRRRAEPVELVRHPDDALMLPAIEATDAPMLSPSGATLGAYDIVMPGPMRVTYELPLDAERFAGTAALSDHAGPWADCDIVIEADGVELWRERLHDQAPAVGFNVSISGAERLTVTVEPGRYGPIQDRVVLRRALVLLASRDL